MREKDGIEKGVLIILVNAVFTLLASHYHWYIDTTEEQLYTLSDTSKALLDEIFKEGADGKTVFDGKLTMTFLQEKDKIEDSQLENAGDSYLKMVHSLALDYAAHYRIEVCGYVRSSRRVGGVQKKGLGQHESGHGDFRQQ